MLIQNKHLNYLFKILCTLIFIFILTPVVVIVLMSFNNSNLVSFPITDFSFKWYLEYFNSREWISATIYSFRIGISTALLSTILGSLAAYAIVRGEFKGKNVLYTLLLTPMVNPPIILAIALYFVFANIGMTGNITSIVIGHTIICLPIVLIMVSNSIQGINPNLEQASVSLGASRIYTFFKIIFPLIFPGIFGGLFFSFLLSFDELLIPMFLGGVHITTLPTKIWSALQFQVDPITSVVSSLIIYLVLLVFIIISFLRTKSQ